MTDAFGGTTFTYQFDSESRLVRALPSPVVAGLSEGQYAYDPFDRLISRTTVNGSVHYIYDQADHIIAEVDGSTAPQTLREYIWLDDQPIAVVSNVNTASPQLLYVHADHLNRPVMMTDQSRAKIWEASYKPFGEVHSVTGLNDKTQRFPGQWYQIETGLTYNWHRHYDGTIGRYLQADPLKIDEREGPTVNGKQMNLPAPTSVSANNRGIGLVRAALDGQYPAKRTLLPDGPSLYGYTGQSPLTATDNTGLIGGVSTPASASKPGLCQGTGFCGFNTFSRGRCIYICVGGDKPTKVLDIGSLPRSLCPRYILN